MAETYQQQSGLAHLGLAARAAADRDKSDADADPGVRLGERAFLGQINLRGDPGDKTFMDAAAGVLGARLPTKPGSPSPCPQAVRVGHATSLGARTRRIPEPRAFGPRRLLRTRARRRRTRAHAPSRAARGAAARIHRREPIKAGLAGRDCQLAPDRPRGLCIRRNGGQTAP